MPALLALLLLACAGGSRPTVLLVSFDTTRADAVGAWQGELTWRPDIEAPRRPAPSTPTLDALAAEGTRMSWALAPAPATLPSHTSVFTGLDPYGHGVLRNGMPLPTAPTVLAERLAGVGYEAIGVVGAAVLGPETGIQRGFVDWSAPEGGRGQAGEREAAAVTDAALARVDAREGRDPLFLFVHYYDPHTPWDGVPPALVRRLGVPGYQGAVDGSTRSFPLLTRLATQHRLTEIEARQARGLYLGEVAHADAELGRLVAGLEARGLLEDALIAVVGDHGEVLDDRITASPYSHGPDVDLVALHVPMLLVGRGSMAPRVPAGRVEPRLARLLDLGSTLLARLDLPPLGEGVDLLVPPPELAAEPPPAFAVGTQARGFVPGPGGPRPGVERAVAWQGHLLVRAPLVGDRLYALADGQPHVPDPTRARALGALLDAFDARAPAGPVPELPAEVQGRLSALGYVEPGGTAPPPPAPPAAVPPAAVPTAAVPPVAVPTP